MNCEAKYYNYKNNMQFAYIMNQNTVENSRIHRMINNNDWVDVESSLRGQTNILSRCQQDNSRSDLMGKKHIDGLLDSRMGFIETRRLEEQYSKPKFNVTWLN